MYDIFCNFPPMCSLAVLGVCLYACSHARPYGIILHNTVKKDVCLFVYGNFMAASLLQGQKGLAILCWRTSVHLYVLFRNLKKIKTGKLFFYAVLL